MDTSNVEPHPAPREGDPSTPLPPPPAPPPQPASDAGRVAKDSVAPEQQHGAPAPNETPHSALKDLSVKATPPAEPAAKADEKKPSATKSKVWIPVLLGLLLIGGGGGYYYYQSQKTATEAQAKKSAEPPPILVSATSVMEKDIPIYLDGLGTVQAYNTVTIHSQVDGMILNVNFIEGQDVHKGDLLVEIDPRPFQANLNQAIAKKNQDEADLNNARINLQRLLEAGDAVTKQSVSDQRALIAHNEAAVGVDVSAIEFQQTQLNYTRILSPLDGRTGVRLVDAGNIVRATDANGLVIVTQLEPISVIATLPQQNLPKIMAQMNRGKLQVIAMDGANENELDQGVLELVDNQIDPLTGTIRLKATFPNKKHKLWPGGFVNTRLLVETRSNALVVDASAVQNGPNGPFLFVIGEDKTTQPKPISIALIQDGQAVLKDGVKAGDQVVLTGQDRLKDGSKVSLAKDKKSAGEVINTSAATPAAPLGPK